MTINHPSVMSQDIGDAEIEYLLYDGSGPTIVFLHATGFMHWLWHPIARELSGAYRIIVPYFCDHRDATPDNGGFAWLQLAADLCSLCKALDIDHPLMVGHSMGGTVITLAAAVHNLSVKKMVLIEPIFLPRNYYTLNISVEEHPLAAKSIKRMNYWENKTEARSYLKSKSLFRAWNDEMVDLYLEHGMTECQEGGVKLTCSPQREAALFMGSRHYDPWPLLPGVTCPALVVAGEKSDMASYIDFKKASAAFPKGSYRLEKNAGHLIPMEKPDATIDFIRSFFASGD